jgi:hypothetical protein
MDVLDAHSLILLFIYLLHQLNCSYFTSKAFFFTTSALLISDVSDVGAQQFSCRSDSLALNLKLTNGFRNLCHLALRCLLQRGLVAQPQ